MEVCIFRDLLHSHAAKIVAELYSISDLPRIRVEEIVSSFENLLQQSFVTKFYVEMIGRLRDLGESPNNLATFKAMATFMQNPFEKFNTEGKCIRYFKRLGSYIEPEEVEVEDDEEHIPAKPPKPLSPPVMIQFFPLRKVLKTFFELPGIFESVQSYISEIRDFPTFTFSLIQSKYWKSVEATCEGEFLLPLLFYQDDVETNNALGSHKGIGKIGAVYIVIPCLPPNLQSKTENIFLLTLYKSSDANIVSLQSILAKAVEEIKFLETKGITVRTSSGERKVKFRLVSVIGDNLAVHNLLGFSKSFSATFSCRFCMIRKSEISEVFNLSSCILRTNESLDYHIQQNDSKSTGISGPSSYLGNDLELTMNLLSVDFMHDLLEGGDEHTIGLVLHVFIVKKKYFTLDDLNKKIALCDYGEESRNKPVPIKMNKILDKHVKMSASEALCFIRNIGIIIGDVVPEDDEHWQIIILLKEIIDIVTSPVVHLGVPNQLESLVSDYLWSLNNLFPGCLKPKHHLLLHYADVMRRFGPLWQFSTIGCESKHRDLTVTAHVSLSRVNICKTLAIKAQLRLNNRIVQGTYFTNKVYDVGRVKTSIVCDILDDHLLKLLVPLKNCDPIQVAESITFHGTTIRTGNVLMIPDEKQCVFHIVHVLFIDANSILHIITKNVTQSTYYDDHYQAYYLHSNYSEQDVFEWNHLTEKDLFVAFFSRVSRVSSGKLFIPKRWI